jgi:hypothetical protein
MSNIKLFIFLLLQLTEVLQTAVVRVSRSHPGQDIPLQQLAIRPNPHPTSLLQSTISPMEGTTESSEHVRTHSLVLVFFTFARDS